MGKMLLVILTTFTDSGYTTKVYIGPITAEHCLKVQAEFSAQARRDFDSTGRMKFYSCIPAEEAA